MLIYFPEAKGIFKQQKKWLTPDFKIDIFRIVQGQKEVIMAFNFLKNILSKKEKGFSMEIWANTLDVLSVSVISPSGESVPRLSARTGTN